MASPSFHPTDLGVMIEELITVVAEFLDALVDSTERSLSLRKLLSRLVVDLRAKSRAVTQRSAVCVPRLVVCGPRQSGRSSLVDFILHRRVRHSAEDDGSVTGRPTSSALSGILSTPSNGRREGHAPSLESAGEDGSERPPTVLQTYTSRRRLLRYADEEIAPRDGPSFHFVADLPHPNWQPLGAGEPENLPAHSAQNVTLLPGAFERTVVDRFMNRAGRAAASMRQGKVLFDKEWDEALRASLWILNERSNTSGEDDVVWRGEKCVSSPRRMPDHTGAEIFFVTIPCDVVGTERLITCVAPLFGTYSSNCKHTCKDTNKGEYECDTEVLHIRQLISDMVFYVLTFVDAITLRADGVLPLADALRQRPPPVATGLRHLVNIFITQMQDVCGVTIAPWQVIPFSSVTSHVTREFLTVTVGSRIHSDSCESIESYGDSTHYSKFSIRPMDFSLVSSALSLCAPPVPMILNEYCDVIFGERFQRRRKELLLEQVERIAFDYATGSTWFTSGAHQLLETLRLFEWSALLHYLHRVALSLLMWSRQMMLVLPTVRMSLNTHFRELKAELRQHKKREKNVGDAFQKLQRHVIPHEISQNIQLRLQQCFDEFTLRFWQRLLALIDGDGNTIKKSVEQELVEYPPSLVEARQRLLLQYDTFVEFYVSSRYECQMAQVLLLLAEEEEEEEVRGGTKSSLNIPNSIPTLDHIPFVAQNARSLKFTMERELTLQLSRLNTEVINYFMAELDCVFGDFVALCDEERNETVSRLSGVLHPLLSAQSIHGVSEVSYAHVALTELSRLSLVDLHPPVLMETFVTGLRAALCEDQILLILRYRGCLARNQEGNAAVAAEPYTPGRRTVAYLNRVDRERFAQLLKRSDLVPAAHRRLVVRGRRPSGVYWASPQDERVVPVRDEWISRCDQTYEWMSPLADSADRWVEGGNRGTESAPSYHKKIMHGGRKLGESDTPLNLIWFVVDVWREALSVMSFSSWMRMRSVRYGKLLNSFCGSFIIGHRELSTDISKKVKCLEDVMKGRRMEDNFLQNDMLSVLQRVSNTATHVADKLKCMRGHVFAGTHVKNNL